MRLIDADALEKSICQDKCGLEECCMTFERDGAEYCLEVQRVKDSPTIEAEPVRRGRWIKSEKSDFEWECSECGYGLTDNKLTYCYDCGAKMDLKEVEE